MPVCPELGCWVIPELSLTHLARQRLVFVLEKAGVPALGKDPGGTSLVVAAGTSCWSLICSHSGQLQSTGGERMMCRELDGLVLLSWLERGNEELGKSTGEDPQEERGLQSTPLGPCRSAFVRQGVLLDGIPCAAETLYGRENAAWHCR